MLRGKGNKYRYFYIQKELSREIAQYAKINKKAGIFPENRFGKKMLTRGIAYHMDKWNKDLGFPKGMLHPHAFRHFFAKQYLKNSKKDIVQLAEFLGHESLDTTRVYLLKSREEQMKDFNKYVNW
jgi:site-specific recombinase XerC